MIKAFHIMRIKIKWISLILVYSWYILYNYIYHIYYKNIVVVVSVIQYTIYNENRTRGKIK